jgi:hypothetical protein
MDKYLVLKWDDINQLQPNQKESLTWAVSLINYNRQVAGKSLDNEYLVVNKDEPYADKVQALIEDSSRQKVEDMRSRAVELCDGIISCSPGSCLADKEIQIVTNFDGEFPSDQDIERHLRAIYEVNHSYNQTYHRATHDPRNGAIKTRLFVGKADLMLTQKQVDALDMHGTPRPLESLLTPEAPKQRRNTDI